MKRLGVIKLVQTLRVLTVAVALLVFATTLPLYLPEMASAAGSSKLYVSPAAGSIQKDNNITVGIYATINDASAVVVESFLTYESAKLQMVSIDTSGTNFETTAQKSATSADVTIVVGTSTPVTGTQLVAKVTFKALAGSGSSSVSFDQGRSAVYDNTANNILTSVASGSFTFTTPTVQPPAAKTPSPPPAKKPAPSAPSPNATAPQNTTSTDTSPPILKEGVSAVQGFNTAVVTLTADEPVVIVMNYGVSRELGLTASTKEYSLTPQLIIDNANLTPGTTYYYEVQAIDASGNTTKSDLASFKTKGYLVNVTLRDKKNRGVADLKVELNSETQYGVTDQDGTVTFYDVAPGSHTVSATIDGEPYSQAINVEDTLGTSAAVVYSDASVSEQAFDIVTDVSADSTNSGFAIAAVVIVVLVVVIVLVILYMKRKGRGGPGSSGGSALPLSDPRIRPGNPADGHSRLVMGDSSASGYPAPTVAQTSNSEGRTLFTGEPIAPEQPVNRQS